MITFKPIIIPGNRRKDGTMPVCIRVTFKGKVRRIPTTLVCQGSDVTRSNRIKNATVLSKAGDLVARMREAVSDLSPFTLEDWDVDRVIAHIRRRMSGSSFRLDFFQWGERYIRNTKTDTTRRAYDAALNALARFIGKRELDVNDITRAMLLDFVDFVEAEPRMHYDRTSGACTPSSRPKIPKGASSRHLMKLQHIYNAAKERYNDEDAGEIPIPRSPFDGIRKTFPPPENGQRNLGEEVFSLILSDSDAEGRERLALDAFVVSFACMGANLADMFTAAAFTGNVWRYNRMKTSSRRADGAEMQVEIPPEVGPWLSRLRGSRKSKWWLPALHVYGEDKDRCTAMLNRGLRTWCERREIQPFTFYAARHTWASLARKAGVEKATIDDCLAHKGDFATTDIYAEKSWDLMREANRKVLDLFKWK